MVPKLSPRTWALLGIAGYTAAVWVFWEPTRQSVPPAVVEPVDADRAPSFGLLDLSANLGLWVGLLVCLVLYAPVAIIRDPDAALDLLIDFVLRAAFATPDRGC